ncbi:MULTISPECIES: hypothetical protein [unclassified Streptomyces]|uniref:hypothetical protein n=1 Tax=unclassified Streptomyces TaxID=2593676 RepID=UPI001F2F0A47|nr:MULTISPECIES: hypothetical protein [unclassified Streptomyces]MCF0086677.1 hypothetical protein [Streptomyces sp. MH192]MCF0098831.1 hypothetical protein [Streptomyces sp. MH191]
MAAQDQPNEITSVDNADGRLAIRSSDIQAVKVAPPPVISIRGEGGEPLVDIHPDGRIEYGSGYQPDEAAQALWAAVQRWAPDPMAQQYGAPLTARINAELAAGQAAQRKVERLDEMAQAWSERLPDAISRDTAVQAIHQVTRGDA